MNQKIATLVVTVLVLAMVGTIAWNEYVHARGGPTVGRWGAGEREGGSYESAPLLSAGARENTTSTTKSILTNSPSPLLTNTHTPTHPSVPSPTLPSTHAPLHPNIPATSTPTPTPTPTVTLPLMQVASQFGVNLRDAPSGEVIQGLADGTLVQPYPSSEEEVDGIRWLHVVTLDGMEGWLAVNNLIHAFSTPTATP